MDCEQKVNELIEYDPATGLFRWLYFGPNGGRKAREWFPGSLDPSGYRAIRIQRRKHWAHRLAWQLMTGALPIGVDHINGDRADNRWANLRAATHSENNRNRGASRNNAIGLKGVHRISRPGLQRPFVAQITHLGQYYHLGYYATAEDAHDAYARAASRLHGEFARTA